jgi:hypothetical protein
MSYKLNKTNGSLLTDLIDGQIDTSSTNLVLVGRNYEGFGEFINENFIKVLENFSNTAPPSNPLEGQLWWDVTGKRLQIFNGEEWKVSGGPFVTPTRPQMVAGDLWINSETRQIYFYDGSNLVLIGPAYSSLQGVSGFQIDSIKDVQSRARPVAKTFVAGNLVSVTSNIDFTPTPEERIAELVTASNPTGTIRKGVNVLDTTNFKFRGTATSSEALINEAGDVLTANQFLPNDAAGETSGTLTIRNNGGIIIGADLNNVQKIVGTTYITENQLTDHDYSIRVKGTAYDTVSTDALYIDSSEARVGIFNGAPEAMLHIGAPNTPVGVSTDVIIEGNLTVRGESTSVDVNVLKVQDINIELGITEDSTLLDDQFVDGGGVILRASGVEKSILWNRANNAWTSNVNFDIVQGRSYKINGVNKISADSIDNSVLYAEGLVRIGTLQYLNVDNINLNAATITTSSPLNITSTGEITVNNQRMTGLAEPTELQDVATKNYVDIQNRSERLSLTLDTTGLTDNQIGYIISSVYPVYVPGQPQIAEYRLREEGTEAFVVTQNLAGSTATNIDIDSVKNVSFVAVDSNGTQNESVVQDINFFPATGNVAVSISRGLKKFTVVGNTWQFSSDVYTDYTLAPGWP